MQWLPPAAAVRERYGLGNSRDRSLTRPPGPTARLVQSIPRAPRVSACLSFLTRVPWRTIQPHPCSPILPSLGGTSMRPTPVVLVLALFAAPAAAQIKAPGEETSRNVHLISHIPLGEMFTTGEIEQELARPYL